MNTLYAAAFFEIIPFILNDFVRLSYSDYLISYISRSLYVSGRSLSSELIDINSREEINVPPRLKSNNVVRATY